MGVKVDPLFQSSENFLRFKFHSHLSLMEHKKDRKNTRGRSSCIKCWNLNEIANVFVIYFQIKSNFFQTTKHFHESD